MGQCEHGGGQTFRHPYVGTSKASQGRWYLNRNTEKKSSSRRWQGHPLGRGTVHAKAKESDYQRGRRMPRGLAARSWWPHMGLGTKRVLSPEGQPDSGLAGASVSQMGVRWGWGRAESLRQLCSFHKYSVSTSGARCHSGCTSTRDRKNALIT